MYRTEEIMHIPNVDVYREMQHEAGGIWFVPAVGTDTHAILLKAPANLLKAIMEGCRIEMSFAVDKSLDSSILVSCLHIYDDKVSPLLILQPHLNPIQKEALVDIIGRESTPIFLFDELSRNVAWAESNWSKHPSTVLRLIQSYKLYHGEIDSSVHRRAISF